jgi:hypothetical protein
MEFTSRLNARKPPLLNVRLLGLLFGDTLVKDLGVLVLHRL